LNKRGRRVPETAITDKALKEVSQFHKLKFASDLVEVYDYFTNKHIFIDMDGVIAAQSTLPIVNGEIDFVNGEIHKWQKPVTPVIEMLERLQSKGHELYILSATANSTAYDEKQDWLDENFNLPKDRRFFVNQGRHKAEMLNNLRRKFKLEHKDVVIIDDMHTTLYDAKKRGMNAMHPSEFLTHEWGLEKRIFNIDVGEIAPDKVDDYMKKVIEKMKTQPFVNPKI
jgi:5'(3')-deoxyribonucleotidase